MVGSRKDTSGSKGEDICLVSLRQSWKARSAWAISFVIITVRSCCLQDEQLLASQDRVECLTNLHEVEQPRFNDYSTVGTALTNDRDLRTEDVEETSLGVTMMPVADPRAIHYSCLRRK